MTNEPDSGHKSMPTHEEIKRYLGERPLPFDRRHLLAMFGASVALSPPARPPAR